MAASQKLHAKQAVEAWIQGRMATFRILVLVSKTEIRSREFSFSSRSLRMKIINLDLVSMPEIGGDFFSVSSRSLRLSVRNSRSHLDVRDWIRETLILVSRMKKWLSLTSATYVSIICGCVDRVIVALFYFCQNNTLILHNWTMPQ